MDKKIKPIAYWEFRFKYFLKSKAPVHGSEEMIFLGGFLSFLIDVITIIAMFWPLTGQLSAPVNYYVGFVFLAAIWRPLGYLKYRISYYREHRYDANA